MGSHGYEKCIRACERSLSELGVDHIDLYLVHSPKKKLIETWDAMIELQRRGLVRSIGVSNFAVPHLEAIAEHRPQNLPVVNQIEMHPLVWRNRRDVLDWCKARGIVTTAYGSMLSGQQKCMEKTVGGLAVSKNKTNAQILL